MPVYHFTFHAYHTWRPDNPRGYVKRNKGILPPDEQMAKWYDKAAAQPPMRFDDEHQRVLVDGVIDIAAHRGWRVHIIATDATHLHVLLSWSDDAEHDWKLVHDTLKQLLGMMLSKHFGVKGRKWFVRKGSRKRVKDRAHFEHLMTDYLPSHRGRIWLEREQHEQQREER